MEIKETIRRILKEYYDKDKLYNRESLIRHLTRKDSNGRYVVPREIRNYVNDLPKIDCYDKNNNKHICTKIPEVLHIYLNNRY